MSGLLDLLSQSIGPEQVQLIAKQIGATPDQTEQAIGLALPTLLGALANHTDDEQNAHQLHKALETGQAAVGGGMLDNLGGMLGGGNGGGGGLGSLLGTILGGRQSRVEQGIGKASGLNATQIASLLAMLAPLVLGVLGRRQKEQNASPTDLTNMLRKERTQMQNQAGGGLLAGLLDQDGDGDFDLSDMLKFGMKAIFRKG